MNRRELTKALGAACIGSCIGRRMDCSAEVEGENPKGRSGQHHFYSFHGTPYQVGYQHGKALRKEIVEEAAKSLNALSRRTNLTTQGILDYVVHHYEPLFRQHLPIVLEEIGGMAAGAELTYAHAFYAATRDGMKATPPGAGACTSFACGKGTTLGDKILLGQTKDTDAPLDRYRIMHVRYESGRRLLILNYPGWTANICLTSQGLASSGNSLFGVNPKEETVPYSFFKRLVMEKSSADQVLEVMKGYKLENGCFLFGDAAGRLVCLESVGGRMDIRDVSGQAFGHANSVLSPDLKGLETKEGGSLSSPMRQKRIQNLLESCRGSIDATTMQRILADHDGYPLSICRHPSGLDSSVTTAAFVANLTDLCMNIAIGNPCRAPFLRYRV